MAALENRYDFVFLFDCQDGNPNGDPDADNRPRVDPQTGNGLVSDVCLKRKLRDYVVCAKSAQGSIEHGYDIYVLGGNSLEQRQKLAYDNLESTAEWKAEKDAKRKVAQCANWMCENFFDVRAFGAVMSTKEYNCGQVRGPLQITFSRSLDKILSLEHTITRVAYTKEEKRESTTGETEFGGKFTIPYGLYVAYGYVNPFFATKTGFSLADLELTRKALKDLFELDRSAARGKMASRCLAIFKHDCKLGNAPAQTLFDSVIRRKRDGVDAPRSFEDYEIALPVQSSLPKGITLIDGLHEELR